MTFGLSASPSTHDASRLDALHPLLDTLFLVRVDLDFGEISLEPTRIDALLEPAEGSRSASG